MSLFEPPMGFIKKLLSRAAKDNTAIVQSSMRARYLEMTNPEFEQFLSGNLKGLTPDALGVIKEEIIRRNLDPGVFDSVLAQQQAEEPPFRVYDEEACPVDEDVRIWIERYFQVLLEIFGKENTLGRKVLVPRRSDFPIRYDGSERAAHETLSIVATQMEVPVEQITLDFFEDHLGAITEGSPGGLYWGKGEEGKFEISLVRRKLDDPEGMVAMLAHEIAHIKLLGENRIEENDELLTDLATIFFGLGVFSANAAFKAYYDYKYYGWSQAGYLTQMEWGYALALFAYIRGESQPFWANHLCDNVKADFIQGQNFIANNEEIILV
ncbi:hypothetical protein FPE01S_01_17590 [Flavihumibacter petaseus NBRC 106054]|uniref:Uncharacterized protein n=2 Tax=Flavihumibacter TaxID=1004301 RepID=A0A0E9MZC2_9BACT|nr:hypothetical protein FPE01S_01_17590 [Flavihumibacter petaseus NBRC 106054]